MNILLTGASGYLGSALARALHGQGHQLALLLRPGSSLARLHSVETTATIGRPADDAQTADFVRSVQARTPLDLVVHTACCYGRQGEPASTVLDTNLRLGVQVLQALLAAPRQAQRPLLFMHAATALPPEVGLYALAKHQFSQWGAAMARQAVAQLQFLDLRLQHFYGPGDDARKFSSHLLRSCLNQAEALDLTACEQRRDFLHVADAMRAIDTVLAHRAELAPVDSIDIGSGDAPPLRQVVELVHRMCGARTRLNFGALPYRSHEPMLCQADTRRLRAWGWMPHHDLASGWQATIDQERTP